MALTWSWCGAATPSGFTVSAKIAGASARLAVSTNVDLSNPVYFGPVSPSGGVVKITATGLASGTRHYWAVEDAGVLDLNWKGEAKTLPPAGQPATITFAVGSCAGLTGSDSGGNDFILNAVSNRPVFGTIQGLAPDLMFHQGDLHYRNIATNNVTLYRDAYDDVLTYDGTQGASARQGLLYRNIPLVYQWDDHDYGPNNSDGSHVGRFAAAQVYRDYVPHYPLADATEGCHHAFEVSRILFVMLDDRYFRDPNANPDGPAHTMLGAGQKQWLRDVLSSSGAQYLVVFSQVDWLRPAAAGGDNWGGFATERNEVAAIFSDTGWANRMHMHIGDRHTMGFSSGATNLWGGFPTFMYGSLDSNPGVSSDVAYDLGITGGRDRFGLVTIADTGDQIIITNRGYIGSNIWQTHTFSVPATPPSTPTEPGEPPPPPSVAVPRTSVTWLSCDLVTGQIITELPDILGQPGRILGTYTSTALSLPIPRSGPGALPFDVWESATIPGRTMIVPVVNDVPMSGHIVLVRERGSDPVVGLGCASLEAYLDRRFVADHMWTQVDEAAVIAAGLLGDATAEGVGLIIDAPATGVLRDREYFDKDDGTILSRVRELMGVENGPEFTIDVDWTDSTQTAVAKVARIRSRIGNVSTSPNAVFTTRGASEARYTYAEDYSDGKGANHVTATASGEGEDRPQQTVSDIRTGWPRWERRYSPSTSISDTATLTAHATADLARLIFGSNTLQITTRWDAHPRYGLDWRLGDDVAWDLIGHGHPNGFTGVGRVIAYELDMQAASMTPILWESDEESA